jgi:hypothetical protein
MAVNSALALKAPSSKLSTFSGVIAAILLIWFLVICWGAVRLLAGRGQGISYCVKPLAECDPGDGGKIDASCLYKCPTVENMDEMVAALESRSGLTRRGALATLSVQMVSQAPDKERLTPVLTQILDDPDQYTRVKAAQVLRVIGTPAALSAIKNFVVTHHRPSAAGRDWRKDPTLQ